MLDLFASAWDFTVAYPFIAIVVAAALTFDFVNGFHDSANAIATVVATKVLTPLQAVMMAGFFNFVGPFVFTLAVASTIGSGIINAKVIGADLTAVVFAALLGAIVWDLITWYVGLPTSSSHALVGGLIGAALAAIGPEAVVMPKWVEAVAILEFSAIGALGGLLGGLVAWGLSRVRLPRGILGPMSFAGALGLGTLFVRGNGWPDFALGRHVLEYFLSLTTMLFMGAVAGAILWVATQRPMRMSLVPGFAGFGLAVALVVATLTKALNLGGVTKTLLFMVVSPVLGFFAGFLLAVVVAWVAQKREPSTVSSTSKRLQLFSSAFYALTHGTNDAQKTMGIIAVVLLVPAIAAWEAGGKVGDAPGFAVPTWVIITSALAMGLGTLFGGWRIVQTMASRITHLTPAQGFAAETGGGVVLVAMAQAGIPVSTTHAISSSIMGVGATKRTSAVRWGVGRRIVGAWILTIPASALIAYASYVLVKLF